MKKSKKHTKGLIAVDHVYTPPDNIAKFDPQHEYGRRIPLINGPADYHDVKSDSLPMRMLGKYAQKILPPGTYYEIRGSLPAYGKFNRSLIWYYSPYLSSIPVSDPERRGYVLLARLCA